MRVKFSTELLKGRFAKLAAWEQGKLYLVQIEKELDLAIGIKAPEKDGQEKRSACVILTGERVGEISLDEVGETSMMALEVKAGWDMVDLVLESCPDDCPIGPGAIGMLKGRDTFFMLLRGADRGFKYAYLHLGELRIRDSNEDLVIRRRLVRIDHPVLEC